jgi:hypothetical protein
MNTSFDGNEDLELDLPIPFHLTVKGVITVRDLEDYDLGGES